MRYKSLPAAFLFQTLVGALCIFSISLFGPAWFATIAILGLRPFILKRVPIFEDSDLWKFYYKIGKISMVATALTIIFVYTVLHLFSHSSPTGGLLLLMIALYFIFIHGVIGLVYSLQQS